DLQQMLFEMVARGMRFVSMEVSSHALSLKRVAGCHFSTICLTNVTQDHLDFHKTMEHYWKAKRLLFEELESSAHASKTAVINLDDPLAPEFRKALGKSCQSLTYGWDKDSGADAYVKRAEFDFGGTRLSLMTPRGELDLKLQLNGRFNVYNSMAAILI